jgi:hypothetical protein
MQPVLAAKPTSASSISAKMGMVLVPLNEEAGSYHANCWSLWSFLR